mmetsp:Transcript_64791/g.204581  ORF Transcript_64791/g.204581 Transcript_64791/m.204581 type:complete len:715 (-) Transcript_64791:69-2213(-)
MSDQQPFQLNLQLQLNAFPGGQATAAADQMIGGAAKQKNLPVLNLNKVKEHEHSTANIAAQPVPPSGSYTSRRKGTGEVGRRTLTVSSNQPLAGPPPQPPAASQRHGYGHYQAGGSNHHYGASAGADVLGGYADKKNKMALNIPKEGLGYGGGAGVDEAQTARTRVGGMRSQGSSGGTSRGALTSRGSNNSGTPNFDPRSRTGSRGGSGATPPVGSAVPMTPATTLKMHASNLTDFEQSEVLEYPQIYFTGNTQSKIRGSPAPGACNHGYDDERGDYLTVLHDHISYRYEVVGLLGKGSFGQVMKCFDYKTNKMVAVKIIRNKKRFHHQALVEVKILEHLRHKDPEDTCNIVHMMEYFYFRNHLCISFELLSINLYEFIKNNNFQGLSLGLIRRFASQLLVSLKFLRKQRVIHCDLKPENILLKQPSKSGIKVIDFGSSCFEDERVYTYIQSRFYRSPEVILGLPYDVMIDMWSFGCILAELYSGYPLFPGENEVEQLACIMEIIGLPPKQILEASTRKKMFFDSGGNPRIVPNSRGKKRRPGTKDLASSLRCNDPAFLSFLEGCLRWDPKERFSPDDALQHEWIAEAQIPPQTYRAGASSSYGSSSDAYRHKKISKAGGGSALTSSQQFSYGALAKHAGDPSGSSGYYSTHATGGYGGGHGLGAQGSSGAYTARALAGGSSKVSAMSAHDRSLFPPIQDGVLPKPKHSRRRLG